MSREVQKLQEELKRADGLVSLGRDMRRLQMESLSCSQLDTELQAKLKKAEDDFDNALRGRSQPDLDPDRLMIDPPSGWRYGFPKRIPREHQHRTIEWMIEQGYPRHLTEQKHFYVRYWNAEESEQ